MTSVATVQNTEERVRMTSVATVQNTEEQLMSDSLMLKLEMKMLLNLPLQPRVLAVLLLMPAMKASNFIMREFTESKTAALSNLIMESLLLDMELMKKLEKPIGLSRIVG